MDEKNEKKHVVYTIIEKPGKKGGYWMKIGIAYINRDQSWNVYLDAIPFDRKLQIRSEEFKPRMATSESHALPMPPTFDVGSIQ